MNKQTRIIKLERNKKYWNECYCVEHNHCIECSVISLLLTGVFGCLTALCGYIDPLITSDPCLLGITGVFGGSTVVTGVTAITCYVCYHYKNDLMI